MMNHVVSRLHYANINFLIDCATIIRRFSFLTVPSERLLRYLLEYSIVHRYNFPEHFDGNIFRVSSSRFLIDFFQPIYFGCFNTLSFTFSMFQFSSRRKYS